MSQTITPDITLAYTRIVERYAHLFVRPETRLRYLKLSEMEFPTGIQALLLARIWIERACACSCLQTSEGNDHEN